MSDIIQLIIRHGLALLGGYFAAHHIDGDTTTGIIVGLIFVFIPVIWSTVAKWLHLDDQLASGITSSQQWRVLIGSVVSQGVTALSAYLAIDANQPELLAGALINVGLSKAGVHQKIALAGAVPMLVACLCMLSLSSCATVNAILASPFGRAAVATADQLAKAVITTTERVGLEQIILQATSKVSALNAEGMQDDPVQETLRQSQMAGFRSVVELAQDKYLSLTGGRYVLPKNPVIVLPQ